MAKGKRKDDATWRLMERTIKSVLKDKEATAAERLKAVDQLARLMHLKHKIGDPEGGGGDFFPGR